MDRPINLYQHEVNAVLAGRQTQLRRALKPQPIPVGGSFYRPHPETRPAEWHSVSADGTIANIQVLRVAPGDRLWVRETLECANGDAVGYPADKSWLPNTPWTWKRRSIPSIHMPRWASRTTLLVDDVRIQRLHDISEADAVAEGIDRVADNFGNGPAYCDYAMANPADTAEWFGSPIRSFTSLWNSINGANSWEANPWVMAVTFQTVLANIDEVK